MKAIVSYNRPWAWFAPGLLTGQAYAELGHFEPALPISPMVAETTNKSPTSNTSEYAMPSFHKQDV